MAVNIGPKIGIDGEKQYRDQLNNIIQQTKTLGSEMKALSASFDKSGSSMMSNRQKADLLTKQIETQRQKLSEQNKMLDEATKKYGENATQTLKWKQAVHDSETAIAELENQLRELPNSLQTIGQKMQTLGNSMASVGRSLTTKLTLPIVGIATAAAKVAMDFEAAMSKVEAVSGATGSDLEKLRNKAIEMGESTVFSATESAEALNYMAMAGWKTTDMLEGIEGVMNLAAAGGEDLATTSDIVTDALTAFGESAAESGRLADIMAAAASNSNTNISMMGETFKYAAPIAGTLGYSMEDLAVATGLMANAGIKATSAGTALRAGLTRLAAPPKAAAEAMDQYKIEITNTDGTMKDFATVMEIIREKLGGLAEDEQAAALKAIFGQNAISGWAAVLNASEEDFTKLSAAINNSSGAAERMAETMRDNLAGEIKLLKSELESTGITFGEIIMPYLKDGVKKLKSLVERLKKLNPEQQKLLVKLLAITAAVGPLLSVTGKFVTTIGTVVNGVGTLVKTLPQVVAKLTAQTAATGAATGAQLALNAAMVAMPLIGVAAAIGGLIAAYWNVTEAAKEADEEFRKQKEITEEIASVGEKVASQSQAMADALDSAGNGAKTTALEARNAADRLNELAGSGSTSESTLSGMAVAVRQLNDLFPDLGLELDRSTGKLNKSQEEIEKYIASAENMTEVQTASEKVQIALDGVSEATANVTEAQMRLDEAITEQSRMQERIDTIRSLSQQYSDGAITLDEFKNKIHEVDERITVLNDGSLNKSGELFYNTGQLVISLQSELEAFNGEVDNGRQVLSDANAELQNAQTAAEQYQGEVDQLTASMEANTEANGTNQESMQGTITKAQETAMAYEDLSESQQAMAERAVEAMVSMQGAVTNSLESQMNMFEEFKEGSAVSTETLLSNMQSQIDGVTQWEENLAALAEKGINQDLLEKLAQMGPSGTNYVSAFNSMTTEELSKANELWLKGLDIQGFGNEAALDLQEAVGQMSVGSEGAWEQLGEDLGLKAKGSAGYIGQGLIDGLEEKQAEVDAAALAAGEDTMDSLDEGLGVESPSWKARASGMFVDEGLKQGLEKGKPQIVTASQSIAQAVKLNLIDKVKGMESQANAAGLVLTSAMARGLASGRGQISSSMSEIVAAVNSGKAQVEGQQGAFNNAGLMLAMGLAAGIAAGQSAVVNAAAQLAAAAVSAAMSALVIGSPSKLADRKIGRMFDAGIAQGIERGSGTVMKSIRELSQDMVAAPNLMPVMAGAGGTVNNMDYGGTVINVYGAQGQDVNELAEIIERKMNANADKMVRAWGR